MSTLFFFATLFSLFYSHLFAVVIIVHGSFASTTSWPQPDGDFFIELENQAKELGESVVTFCWSGIPTDNEIINGGKMLAQLTTSYPEHEKIITIGHSHGGNVINIASQLLHKLNKREYPVCTTEHAPIVLEIPLFVTKPEMDLSITRSAHSSLTFETLLTQAEKELIRWTQTRKSKNLCHKKIDFVYTLGTPVDMKKFYPEMNAINRMIGLYSEADMIQPVLGLFDRTYPAHPQRSNLRVTLCLSSSSKNQASHAGLHHHLIGRWLLCIPDVLAKLNLGNFEQCAIGYDGSIEFNEQNHPSYQKL